MNLSHATAIIHEMVGDLLEAVAVEYDKQPEAIYTGEQIARALRGAKPDDNPASERSPHVSRESRA